MPKSRTLQRLKCLSQAASPFGRSSLLKAFLATVILAALSGCGGGGGGLGGPSSGTGTGSGSGSGSGSGTDTTTGTTTTATKIGYGTGAGFAAGTINASETSVDASETFQLRVNVVNNNNEPPSEPATVVFSSPCVASGLASFGTLTQVTTGLFSINYTNSGCDGPDTVLAALGGTTQSASVTLTTIGPEVLTVNFVSSTLDQLSLAGIGGEESTELTFRVGGPQGVPIVGQQVNFAINTSVGGASILAGFTSALTDQSGLARTIIRSGTIAGPVNVRATHVESGKSGLSQDIIISTGVPESGRFSMSRTPSNPLNAFRSDGVIVDISIIASDTFGNDATDGTRVSFVSPESGNVDSSCLLVSGECTVQWRSSSPRPANNRLTIIAYTDGAEAWVDNNGNKVYDAGDGAITDQGEPYADENEDGIYNLGEFFFDTNQNGVRNGGNGQWDGPCLDKVAPSAICTGADTVSIYDSFVIVMPTNTPVLKNLGTFPAPGTTISVPLGGSASFSGMIVGDNNAFANNPLAVGTSISFVLNGTGLALQGASSEILGGFYTAPSGPYGVSVRTTEVALSGGTGTLTLRIAVPDETAVEFTWPLSIP